MDNNGWRIPNEEEKKHVLYWMKKCHNEDGIFPVCCTGVMLAVCIFPGVPLLSQGIIWPAVIICLTAIISFVIAINTLLAWKETLSMVSEGKFRIIDAKIVDYKFNLNLLKVSYCLYLLKVSYWKNEEIKIKTLRGSRAVLRNSEIGDSGYIVYFPHKKNKLIDDYQYIPGVLP